MRGAVGNAPPNLDLASLLLESINEPILVDVGSSRKVGLDVHDPVDLANESVRILDFAGR